MNLPTNPTDTSRKATQTDMIAALATLSTLPSRAVGEENENLTQAQYIDALEGVTFYALSRAVKDVRRGALRHGFFPSPPELRILCDRIDGEVRRARAMERHIAEQQAENERLKAFYASKTPESRERVRKLLASIRQTPEDDQRTFMEAMEAKYGKEVIDAAPDNPKAREKMGLSNG